MNKYLSALVGDTGSVELRHNINGRWETYWFTDPVLIEATARTLTGNIYTTLNAPKLGVMQKDKPVQNDDIAFITRIPFDFDPARPTGVASTKEELALAAEKAKAAMLSLHKRDWPLPLKGASGNGYHLQYRCRLPNNEETKSQLKAIYTGLGAEWSSDRVIFDTSVRNAGRIFRLYGTMNRKGVHTEERPHRMTSCVIPQEWRQVTRKQIDQLANVYAKKPAAPIRHTPSNIDGRGDYRTLNIAAWFQAHGLYKKHIEDNIHEVTCPWEHEHSTSNRNDTVIFDSNGGWPGFYCHHAHCDGRGILDVMEVLGDVNQFCGVKYAP